MPQNIILCIERSKKPCEFPEALANLYMNRFAIDEDAAFEIVDIIRLTGIHRDKTEKHFLRNVFKKQFLLKIYRYQFIYFGQQFRHQVNE